MGNVNETFGVRLSRLRKQSKLTQEQLAQASGISPITISRLEHDGHCPSMPTVFTLAKALKVPASELVEPLLRGGHHA